MVAVFPLVQRALATHLTHRPMLQPSAVATAHGLATSASQHAKHTSLEPQKPHAGRMACGVPLQTPAPLVSAAPLGAFNMAYNNLFIKQFVYSIGLFTQPSLQKSKL
jgi:hypothetical protein